MYCVPRAVTTHRHTLHRYLCMYVYCCKANLRNCIVVTCVHDDVITAVFMVSVGCTELRMIIFLLQLHRLAAADVAEYNLLQSILNKNTQILSCLAGLALNFSF